MWFEQWENNIYLLIIFLLPTNHDYGRLIQHLYDIEFFIYYYLALSFDINIK